jgi:hypothetical protein
MPKKKKTAKRKTSRKISTKKPAKIIKSSYYDKFDERAYSGSELSVERTQIKTRGTVLKHLEKDVVKQDDEEIPLEKIADEEDELHEDPRASEEGLGIEEEEAKGEEAYPEIEKAEKDPDEEEEEE